MEDPDQLLLGGVLAGGIDGEEVLTEVHAAALVGVKQPGHQGQLGKYHGGKCHSLVPVTMCIWKTYTIASCLIALYGW